MSQIPCTQRKDDPFLRDFIHITGLEAWHHGIVVSVRVFCLVLLRSDIRSSHRRLEGYIIDRQGKISLYFHSVMASFVRIHFIFLNLLQLLNPREAYKYAGSAQGFHFPRLAVLQDLCRCLASLRQGGSFIKGHQWTH